MIYKALDEYSKRDLNPHSHYWPKDFKSFVDVYKRQEYLDLYGGPAVISIGHAHPHYVEILGKQVATLGFYSNAVINELQQQLAERLRKVCGYDDYSLFLINSGAEANENALKLASFHNCLLYTYRCV